MCLYSFFDGERIIMKSRMWFSIICVFALLGAAGCATNQDMARINDRLASLERRGYDTERSRDQRIEDFRKSQVEKERQLRSEYAEIYAKIDGLQDQIQTLNGKIEEKQHAMGQGMPAGASGDLDSRITALDQSVSALKDRVTRIEEYLAMDGSAKKAPPAVKPGSEQSAVPNKAEPPAPKVLSENELYAKSKQEFDQGDLENARTGFQDFLKRFPKSSIADSAQFWIGEIYFRQKWYEKAILEYQKVIEHYPKGNKVQAALLKQGLSFYNLGDKANARLVLKELVSKYPSSSEARIAKHKLEGS